MVVPIWYPSYALIDPLATMPFEAVISQFANNSPFKVIILSQSVPSVALPTTSRSLPIEI